MADEAVGTLTMLASPRSPGKSGSIAQSVESHPRLDVNEKYMDVGFTNAPIRSSLTSVIFLLTAGRMRCGGWNLR